jgi:hypothetical protein
LYILLLKNFLIYIQCTSTPHWKLFTKSRVSISIGKRVYNLANSFCIWYRMLSSWRPSTASSYRHRYIPNYKVKHYNVKDFHLLSDGASWPTTISVYFDFIFYYYYYYFIIITISVLSTLSNTFNISCTFDVTGCKFNIIYLLPYTFIVPPHLIIGDIVKWLSNTLCCNISIYNS